MEGKLIITTLVHDSQAFYCVRVTLTILRRKNCGRPDEIDRDEVNVVGGKTSE